MELRVELLVVREPPRVRRIGGEPRVEHGEFGRREIAAVETGGPREGLVVGALAELVLGGHGIFNLGNLDPSRGFRVSMERLGTPTGRHLKAQGNAPLPLN